MRDRLIIRPLGLLLVVAALFLAPVSRAQDDSEAVKGIDTGNYNIQQSVELGYRGTWIDGNQDTYGTFVNLRTGPRVLDYSVHVRSLNHQGLLFDRLDFTNFGYGGDPDNVSRLRADKNKWFDFSGVFRRHKNFWDYNLLANPLNQVPIMPSAGNPLTFPITNPVYPVTRSPHSLNLVRRMQDYDLTLLPQSRVRFRVGYSRDVDEGPSLTSFHGTTDFLLAQNFRMTTNAYHVGVDFRVLPKTTISYDQFLEYNKQDTIDTLANTPFTVSTAQYPPLKVDMGLNWYYQPGVTSAAPCNAPFLTTGYANPTCKQYVSYSRTAPARNFLPTERVSLQSTYFTNFEMSGSASYSTSDNKIKSLNDIANEWINSAASLVRDAIVMGPAEAKEVFVHANWAGVYSVTQKVRVRDAVRYDNWRSPGVFNYSGVNLFAAATGTYNILSPVAAFAPLAPAGPGMPTFTAICPSPYTAATCPQHTATASEDYKNTLYAQFWGQRLISNTIQVEADFTPRISGRIGYMYETKKISEFELDSVTNTGASAVGQILSLTYYPGGSTAAAGNDYLAARGYCPLANVGGPSAGGTCSTPSPIDGSITWTVDPAQLSSELTTPRDVSTISEHVGLAGVTLRPMDTLRINADFQFGYNDFAYTRIWPRQIQSYKVHATYTPRSWATVDAAVDIHENRDNVSTVNNLEHGRTYSVTTVLAPNPKFAYTLGYNFTDLSAQTFVCFRETWGTMTNVNSGTSLPTWAACPASIFDPGVPAINLGATAFYTNKQHYAYSDVMWKPTKKVTTRVGYSGAFAGGSTLFLNPLQPGGTLAFTYQKPFASVEINAYKGLSYKVQWNYYGYNSKTPMNVSLPIAAGASYPNPSYLTLAPIPAPDFNGNAAIFSVRYAF
ncbi:MAG: hypothetical protein LAN59_00265 [Acidobacteriia bacterium]|nr:hypothetical protein [Terriglobia bacterium]